MCHAPDDNTSNKQQHSHERKKMKTIAELNLEIRWSNARIAERCWGEKHLPWETAHEAKEWAWERGEFEQALKDAHFSEDFIFDALDEWDNT